MHKIGVEFGKQTDEIKKIKDRLDTVESELGSIKGRLDGVENRITGMDGKLDRLLEYHGLEPESVLEKRAKDEKAMERYKTG